MKIPIQLKEKHLCYCGSFMKNVVAHEYFHLLANVRTVLLAAAYQPEDLVSIEVEGADLVKIYRQLGEIREAHSAGVNKEMKDLLMPQLVTLSGSIDPAIAAEAQAVGASIMEINATYAMEVDTNFYTPGRAFLMGANV